MSQHPDPIWGYIPRSHMESRPHVLAVAYAPTPGVAAYYAYADRYHMEDRINYHRRSGEGVRPLYAINIRWKELT